MRSYLFDDLPGDQRLPHDTGVEVSTEELARLGVLYWHIPVDQEGRWEEAVNGVATKRGYKNRDIINVTKEGLGDSYEAKLKMFFEEHMHEDEEIRFILSGSGFFDVRDQPTDRWIRVAMEAGDLLVLPTGIYHRFTLDENNAIEAIRLFQDEPKWTPYNRGQETDQNAHRLDYLRTISAQS